MLHRIKTAAKTLAVATAGALASASAFAEGAVATTPVELITQHSADFLPSIKEVLFAGAGLVIGAYLIKALINLVIQFFRRS